MLINPEAGVTPAKPAIAPLMAAIAEGFPDLFHESRIHTIEDAADAP